MKGKRLTGLLRAGKGEMDGILCQSARRRVCGNHLPQKCWLHITQKAQTGACKNREEMFHTVCKRGEL